MQSFLIPLTVEVLLVFNIISSTFSGSLSVFPYSDNQSTLTNPVLKFRDRTLISESSVMIECRIMVSIPLDACEPVQSPPKLLLAQNWVLLTELDDYCGLGQKISNAAKAGFVALIAKNTGANDTGLYWVPTDTASSYGLKNNLIYVSVLGEFDANRLQKFAFPSRSYLRIEFEAGRTTVFYIILIGGLFAVFIVAGLLLKIFSMDNNSQPSHPQIYPLERYQRMRRALQQRITGVRLHRIPICKWSQSAEIYSDTCAICLDGFNDAPENHVRVFNCSHAFHASCIDPWIIKETTKCPICMKNVFSKSRKEIHSNAI